LCNHLTLVTVPQSSLLKQRTWIISEWPFSLLSIIRLLVCHLLMRNSDRNQCCSESQVPPNLNSAHPPQCNHKKLSVI
jgi:hypothetical protein